MYSWYTATTEDLDQKVCVLASICRSAQELEYCFTGTTSIARSNNADPGGKAHPKVPIPTLLHRSPLPCCIPRATAKFPVVHHGPFSAGFFRTLHGLPLQFSAIPASHCFMLPIHSMVVSSCAYLNVLSFFVTDMVKAKPQGTSHQPWSNGCSSAFILPLRSQVFFHVVDFLGCARPLTCHPNFAVGLGFPGTSFEPPREIFYLISS